MGASYAGKSLSGTPTQGTSPAHLAGGVAATPRAADDGISPVIGGQDWVGEERQCSSTLKSNGWPCPQLAREGHTTCFGHRHDEG